jgi:hypothetical protein
MVSDLIIDCYTCSVSSPSNKILLIPDRDTDGLTSGTILSRTLRLLSHPQSNIHTHFLPIGTSIFTRESLSEVVTLAHTHAITHLILLDHGSRESPPLLPPPVKTLLIDHHSSSVFPANATILSAAASPPIACSSLLTFELCKPLHARVREDTAWLALLGIFGDHGPYSPLIGLGELTSVKKAYTATHTSALAALLNAPRRTPECNTCVAWELLQIAIEKGLGPKQVLKGNSNITGSRAQVLLDEMRSAAGRIKTETERCSHVAPVFSKDRRVAVVYMHSPYQIHSVVAARWASTLKGKGLMMVMAANGGYIPGKVNFSCRVVKGKEDVDIIEMLHEYAARDHWLAENVGEDWGRGHKASSGGSVTKEVWKAFLDHGLQVQKTGTQAKQKVAVDKSNTRD